MPAFAGVVGDNAAAASYLRIAESYEVLTEEERKLFAMQCQGASRAG
jgi:hypothetical protein